MNENYPVEYKPILDELLDIWQARLSKNVIRRRYYDGENVLKDLNISIPPSLKNIKMVVGWPKKAVSALSTRSRFDGFTASDGETAAILDDIVRSSKLKRKYRQAVESELIAGCDFATISRGANGEPDVIVSTHSAEDAAAVWDERLGRIAYGLVINEYKDGSPVEMHLYTSTETVHLVFTGVRWEATSYPHKLGRPMMVAFSYHPTEAKPFGQSRVSKAVRSITDNAVREAVRTEISAEFFTSPQKYILGVDDDPFKEKAKWEAYIGNIFTISKTEDGDTPQYGQLPQGTMQPHTEYMRSLAAQFSGETNVPVSQLGIIHDNPSSAEAIYAANEPLIIEAQDLNEDNSDALVDLALMALCISLNVTPDALTDEQRDIVPNFKNPAMPSLVSQADAMLKVASIVPGFAGTDVFFEQLGFSEDMRRKASDQMTKNAGRRVLDSLLAGDANANTSQLA